MLGSVTGTNARSFRVLCPSAGMPGWAGAICSNTARAETLEAA